MVHFRLVSNGLIVDAVSGDDAIWIEENIHNYSMIIGERDKARGILSSDGGTVYHIEGTPPFHDFPHYPDARVEDITEEEYLALRDELEANGVISSPEPEPEFSEPEVEPVVKKSSAILALEAQVAELAAANAMLTDCLLEMSEIVYG